jgi:hypothetical protein
MQCLFEEEVDDVVVVAGALVSSGGGVESFLLRFEAVVDVETADIKSPINMLITGSTLMFSYKLIK